MKKDLEEIRVHCPEMRDFVHYVEQKRKNRRFDIITTGITIALIIAGWFLVVQWQVG